MEQTQDPKRPRRYYLDIIRVSLVSLVFAVHCAMPFNSAQPWAIANADTSFAITACVGFCYQWGMPLFFLVAGASAGLSLRTRGNGAYLRERFRRIAVPYIVGLATIVPVQQYVEGVHNGSIEAPFFTFYIQFLEDAMAGWSFGMHVDPSHLWFLRFLFAYSVISLPFSRWLASGAGRRRAGAIAAAVDGRALVLVCAFPVALVQMALRATFHTHASWSDFFSWFIFFFYGCLFAADRRFERVAVRQGKFALGFGIACFLLLGILYQTGHVEPWEETPAYSLGCMAYESIRSVNTCCWTLFFLYLGIHHLNRGAPWLPYANEAVLPFYILHHVVVIVIAFYVVQAPGGILVKYLLVSVPAFAVTVGTYAVAVRRFTFLRVLFGMPARKK